MKGLGIEMQAVGQVVISEENTLIGIVCNMSSEETAGKILTKALFSPFHSPFPITVETVTEMSS